MTRLTRRYVVTTAGVLVLGAGAAYAAQRFFGGFEELTAAPVYAPDGVALGGTDPVAYFVDNRPVQGKARHAFEWNGATWHFATAQNRDSFAAEPDRYAPQYGGFLCLGRCGERQALFHAGPQLGDCRWQALSELQR